jgi:hypothetical protein
MASLAPYALPGIIVLTSAGAFLMCLLVIRYGFTPLEEDPEEAAHRLFLTRLAHAAAAVCFAGAALLAVAAWSARSVPAGAAGRGAGPAEAPGLEAEVREQAREILRLTEALQRLQLDVEERLAAADAGAGAARRPAPRQPEETTAADRPAASAGGTGALPPRKLEGSPESARPGGELRRPAGERGQPAPESRRPTAEAPRPPATAGRPAEPAEGGDVSALVSQAAARTVTATVQGVRVQVEMRPAQEHETAYLVRLTGPGRRPLAGAEASISGQTPDGRPVQTTLVPAGEPGVLHGRLPSIAQDLRLRVAGPGTRFEVSLAGETRW